MRRVALGDVLLAFAVADGLLGAGVLWAASRAWLAPLPVAAAIAAIVLDRLDRRGPALAVLLLCAFLVPQAVLLGSRPPEAPVQDGLLVTDAGAARLLHGLNPYGHDYVDTGYVRAFWLPELPVNPLLAHYVYPPGMLLLAAPLRALGLSASWLWLPALPALVLAAWYAGRHAAVVAATLSPALLLDYLYLFNDLFVLAAALLALGLLRRRRHLLAGAALGAAVCLKQTALVLALPALALAAIDGRRSLAHLLAGAAVLPAIVVLPFLAWSPAAFVADTAAYFYGSGVDAFPIRGVGLPGLLLDAGAVPSRWSSYPAALVQGVAGAAVAVLGWRWLARRPGPVRFWLWAAAIAGVLFLLGRTLAPNYVTLLATLLLLAWTSSLDDRPPVRSAVVGDQNRPPGDARVEPAAG